MLRLLAIAAALALGLSAPAAAQQRAADTLIDQAKSAMIAGVATLMIVTSTITIATATLIASRPHHRPITATPIA